MLVEHAGRDPKARVEMRVRKSSPEEVTAKKSLEGRVRVGQNRRLEVSGGRSSGPANRGRGG